MQELRSELLSSSSPSPSSASQGWGSWQARPLCVNLCPLHPGSLLTGKRERPAGERAGEEQAATGTAAPPSPSPQPTEAVRLRRHPRCPSGPSSMA